MAALKTLAFWTLLVLPVSLGAGGPAKLPAPRFPLDPKDFQGAFVVVKESLPKIQSLMDSGPTKVGDPVLGHPLPYVWLRIDKLKAMPPDGDVLAVAETKPKKALYPVCSRNKEGKAVYSIEVQYKKERWQVGAFGSIASTKLLFETRDRHARETKTPLSAYFALGVPGLSSDFVGVETSSGNLQLIPVLTDQEAGFVAGKAMPSAAVVSKLREMASKVDSIEP